MKCLREGELIDHEEKSYSYKWMYDKNIVQVLPLTKYSLPSRNIEQYYTGPFAKVNMKIASRYNLMSSDTGEDKPRIEL